MLGGCQDKLRGQPVCCSTTWYGVPFAECYVTELVRITGSQRCCFATFESPVAVLLLDKRWSAFELHLMAVLLCAAPALLCCSVDGEAGCCTCPAGD